jgi:asparagine synthase (glutamine-hydrolysing)
MCGLSGILRFDGRPIDADVLVRMADLQRHRGPDDQGFYAGNLRLGRGRALTRETNGPVEDTDFGFAFNRLSILDLSPAGHQPMVSEDGTVVLVFNGEIYNAFDERPALETAGYNFHSNSDTEVILRLYQRHGIDGMLARMNGMFALCIADLKTNSIWLARDRLGVKPLHLWRDKRALLFSSEIKSFFACDEFQPSLDGDQLDEFISFRYASGSASLLKGVVAVAPGELVHIGPGGEMQSRRYWSLPDGAELSSETDLVSSLNHRLRESVRKQLLSDVKLGSQLSGGIDSSLVSLFAAQEEGADLDAISIVFDDPKYSEEQWIDQVAATQPMKVHKHKIAAEGLGALLSEATWHFDQPLNHPNSIGIWRIAEEARKHVTILLSGEGADEVFGGYPRFAAAGYYGLLAPLLPVFQMLPKVPQRRLMRWSRRFQLTPEDLFIVSSAALDPDEAANLRPDHQPERAIDARRGMFERAPGQDFLTRCMNYETGTFLPDVLMRQDKMTMAHSIESRVPFLDHELVEFARTIPTNLLVRRSLSKTPERSTKILLKKLASKAFDESFVYRKKSGFGLPLTDYLRDGEMSEMIQDSILPGIRQRGVMDASSASAALKRAIAGDDSATRTFWSALTFELWCQRFLDERTTKGLRV